MSNPLLTTIHSKLDTRVIEPSGVGVGSTHDRFNLYKMLTNSHLAKTFMLKLENKLKFLKST